MSGFTQAKENGIEIEHFSTASLLKITFTSEEPKNQSGEMETKVVEHWITYSELDDLKKVVDLAWELL